MNYPYLLKTSSLKDFLQKISLVGVPEKITQKTLSSMGYKSSSERSIISVLKFIDFINDSGSPTENYKNFRSKEKSVQVMIKCLKSSYKELFEILPDAYKQTSDKLRDFFSVYITAGERVINSTISTFKTLCDFADFESSNEGDQIKETSISTGQLQKPSCEKIPQITLNLNIQLQLPTTENAEIYEKIFKALKESLLSKN